MTETAVRILVRRQGAQHPSRVWSIEGFDPTLAQQCAAMGKDEVTGVIKGLG